MGLNIAAFSLDEFDAHVEGRTVHLSGSLTVRDPATDVQPYFRRIHDAAIAGGVDALDVDVRDLSFVNSSSLRLFIDWAVWVRDSEGYALTFVTDKEITWQRTSFGAIRSIVGEAARIDDSRPR